MRKYAKKFITMLAVLSAAAALCACSKTAAAPETAKETAAEQPAANMPNPMKEVTAEQQLEETGLLLEAPEGAEGVMHFIIDMGDNEEKLAQVIFTLDGKEFVYRAQATGKTETYDMTGNYFDPEESAEADIQGRNGTLLLGKEAASLFWLDVVPGINYSLGCSAACTKEEITELANTVFKPVQGEVG